MKTLKSLLHKIAIVCASIVVILLAGILYIVLGVGWLLEKCSKKEKYIGY